VVSALFPPSHTSSRLGESFLVSSVQFSLQLHLIIVALLDSASVWPACESLAGWGKDGAASHVAVLVRRSALPTTMPRMYSKSGLSRTSERCEAMRTPSTWAGTMHSVLDVEKFRRAPHARTRAPQSEALLSLSTYPFDPDASKHPLYQRLYL
jgi:hypothetical protein